MIVLGINFSVSAQFAVLSGKVTDQEGQPLPGATIMITGTQSGVASDNNGHFKLSKVSFGSYELAVSMVGYQKKVITVLVRNENPSFLTITLSASHKALDEIVVIGKSEATALRQSPQAVAVLETQTARLQTADLGEVMAKVQGVNVQRGGGLGSDTRFSLNGLTDDQIRFFLDGIPLDFVGYSFGIANVPVNLIDRVEIYKGVVPIRFGADALGGAVNLVSPEGFFGYRWVGFIPGGVVRNTQGRTQSAAPGRQLRFLDTGKCILRFFKK